MRCLWNLSLPGWEEGMAREGGGLQQPNLSKHNTSTNHENATSYKRCFTDKQWDSDAHNLSYYQRRWAVVHKRNSASLSRQQPPMTALVATFAFQNNCCQNFRLRVPQVPQLEQNVDYWFFLHPHYKIGIPDFTLRCGQQYACLQTCVSFQLKCEVKAWISNSLWLIGLLQMMLSGKQNICTFQCFYHLYFARIAPQKITSTFWAWRQGNTYMQMEPPGISGCKHVFTHGHETVGITSDFTFLMNSMQRWIILLLTHTFSTCKFKEQGARKGEGEMRGGGIKVGWVI